MSSPLKRKRPSPVPHPDSLTRYTKSRHFPGATQSTLELLTSEYLQLNSSLPTFTGAGMVGDADVVDADMADAPGVGIYRSCGGGGRRRGFATAAVMPALSEPRWRPFKCGCGHESSLEEE